MVKQHSRPMERPNGGGFGAARRDLLWALLIVIAVSGIFVVGDISEWWYEKTRSLEAWEIDEITGLLIGLLFAALWFSYRRGTEAQRALRLLEAAGSASRESEIRFRAFVENAPTAISLKTPDGHYLLVNRRFEDLMEINRETIRGKTSAQVFPAAFARSGQEQDRLVVASGAPVVHEEELVTNRGARALLTAKFPILDERGQIQSIGAIHTDITEYNRIQRELKLAMEEAERANETKSRFLAAASHDLRQPLHALVLLLASLSIASEDTQRGEIVRQMRSGLDAMRGLLNALLDVSELEAGAVKPTFEDFSAQRLLATLAERLAPQVRAKGLELRVVPSSQHVRCDFLLLGRIVENFLTNAMRYTETGKILLGCRRRGSRVRIEVWDSGIGILEGQTDAIFEDYYQLDNPERERSKGLGLGLAIVHRLSKLLDLPVEVRSKPGKGSMFAVEVPTSAAEVHEINGRSLEDLDASLVSGTIFLIEDDDFVVAGTRSLLEAWGLTVKVAIDNGTNEDISDALSVRPDVIIADYRLPKGRSGLDLVRRIRQVSGRAVPAIVVTGDISPAVAEEARAAGCVLLEKPVEPTALRSAIEAHL